MKRLPGYLCMALLSIGTIGAIREASLQHSAQRGPSIRNVFERTPTGQLVTAEEVRASHTDYERLIHAIRHRPHAIRPMPAEYIDSETLWLARVIYSETKRVEEMELVAWAIRNRVDTGYRGRHSYQSVALDPFQFSAFNPGNGRRMFYANLNREVDYHGWQHALVIAYQVRWASPEHRPFPIETRHFYSERSMIGSARPNWALGKNPVVPRRGFAIDERRFRFYEGVS